MNNKITIPNTINNFGRLCEARSCKIMSPRSVNKMPAISNAIKTDIICTIINYGSHFI